MLYDLIDGQGVVLQSRIRLIPSTPRLLPGQRWVPTSLTIDLCRQDKSAEIDLACRNQILNGFSSSALGASYHYPAKLTDQYNLSGSIIDSLLPDTPTDWTTLFWCEDGDGVWAFRLHTAIQIQQVGRDAKTAILTAMSKNEVLQAQIQSATSLEGLAGIVW